MVERGGFYVDRTPPPGERHTVTLELRSLTGRYHETIETGYTLDEFTQISLAHEELSHLGESGTGYTEYSSIERMILAEHFPWGHSLEDREFSMEKMRTISDLIEGGLSPNSPLGFFNDHTRGVLTRVHDAIAPVVGRKRTEGQA